MKSLSATETQSISGGLRAAQLAGADRTWRRFEPIDPIFPVEAPSGTADPARAVGASSTAFAYPISLTGFVAPRFMTGEPIRTFPIVDTPITMADSPDDSEAQAQADSSIAASNADTFGGGGDAGAAGGCSAGDGGSCSG